MMDWLMKAVKTGSLEVVQQLVAVKGLPVNSDWTDYDALNRAIMDGRSDIAKFLLRSDCRVNNTHKDALPHDTPLHFAVRSGDKHLTYELLLRKASILALNTSGCTPLHLALLFKHEQVIDVILDFIVRMGNFVNPKSNYGLTHMHVACTRSNVRAIEGFLKNRADMNDKVSGHSPWWPGYMCLHFAVEFQSLLAVELLTKRDPWSHHYARNSHKLTPLQLAQKRLKVQSAIVDVLSTSNSQLE